MKIAVVGSRNLTIENFEDYIPAECTELISGGAKGIDTCARLWAEARGIPVTEFLPDYTRYGRGAPMVRNRMIVDAADRVIAFWDGTSKGTAYTVRYAEKQGKPVTVISPDK
ncbi:MAG: DUF2493 domain-containing protein [Ruminococcaceae bacterium]|nr:DUF2493 domain-containing protein [Oscillospiraceae bacterium]